MHLFFILIFILASAKVLGFCFKKCSIPSVLGELFAGVVLGPSFLGWISPEPVLHFLAEMGVVLLLFEVGIDMDIKRLRESGQKALSVACWGVFLPLVIGFLVAHFLFRFSILEALFVGGTLTATSIGITVRVLEDLKQRHTHEAHIVIGAAILDDILGVLLLAILYDFALRGKVDVEAIIPVFLQILLFILFVPFISRMTFDFLSQSFKKYLPLFFWLFTILMLGLFSYLATVARVPVMLAGFAIGVSFSRYFVLKGGEREPGALKIQTTLDASMRKMRSIIHLLTPFFFVMVGVALDLKHVPWQNASLWLLIIVLFFVALFGKFCAGFFIRESLKNKIRIGVAMMPRGEVGLIFANLGLASGVFALNIYTPLVIVVALTTFFPPLLLRSLYKSRFSS